MEKNKDMNKLVSIMKMTLLARDEEIEKLENNLVISKAAFKDEKKKNAVVQEELDTIYIRIERQQNRVSMFEKENMKKLDEIDRLMNESDKSREELARLHRTYNFNMIDICNETLSNYAAWGSKLVPQVSRLQDVLDQYFNCRLCNTLPDDMMIMQPCEHIFCKQCLTNQGHIGKCPSCNKDKERVIQTEMLTDLVDTFESIIQDVSYAKNEHKMLEVAYQKVEEAKRFNK